MQGDKVRDLDASDSLPLPPHPCGAKLKLTSYRKTDEIAGGSFMLF